MKKITRLSAAADVFLESLIDLRAGERMLIYQDASSDAAVARAIKDCAEQRGADVALLDLDSGRPVSALARDLVDRMAAGFDVICELSAANTFYSTPVWNQAHLAGARLYSLSTLDTDAFVRCVGEVDHRLVYQLGVQICQVLKSARRMHIRTAQGTDLGFAMDWGRVESVLKKIRNRFLHPSLFRGWRQEPYVAVPTGLLDHGVSVTFLGGQLGFFGAPETIRGTAMVDGYLWPPTEIKRLETPIRLNIDRGTVTEIDGGAGKGAVLDRWLGGNSRKIFHFLVGHHPRATLSGEILEAERAYGCLAIGFGVYPFHTDGVMLRPTVVLDDNEVLVDQGRFIHRELAELDRRLFEAND